MDEQEKAKKPIWKRWWFWACVVVFLIIIAASGGESSKPTSSTTSSTTSTQSAKPQTQSTKPKTPDLELIETHVEKDEFARYVAGTVKNNTDHQYKYVQVEINLYDSSGAQVDSTFANTTNLEPQGVWKFKSLPIVDDNVVEYKVKEITGY